jgi:hypothetical protein
MNHISEARVGTAHGRKYAAQRAKHWGPNLAIVEQAGEFRITFPKDARGANWPGDAVVTLAGDEQALLCRIEASAPGQLEGLKGAVARHADRFAFREAPLAFEWHDQ